MGSCGCKNALKSCSSSNFEQAIEKTDEDLLNQSLSLQEDNEGRAEKLLANLQGKRWPKGKVTIFGDFDGKLDSLESLPGTHHMLGWSTNPTTGHYNYLFLLQQNTAEKYLKLLVANPKAQTLEKEVDCSIFKYQYKDYLTAAFLLTQKDNNPYILNTGINDFLWFRLKPYFRFLLTGENPYRPLIAREEIDMRMKEGKIPIFLPKAIESQYNSRLYNRLH